MAQNKYIRPFDEVAATLLLDFGLPKYRAQVLSDHQTGLFLGIFLEEGGCGPELHYHESDQIYFLTRGSVKIRLGEEIHDVAKRSLIFIPAGLPHSNWNSGAETEVHLEMLFPSPHRFRQLAYMVDKPENVPDKWKTSKKAYVRGIDQAKVLEPAPGLKTFPLADPSSGSDNAYLYYAELLPQKNDPTTHIHEFDQYYFVLEGELTVEVALQKHVAKAETLIVLPAGVPYRYQNTGEAVAKHLSILVPPPGPDKVHDIGVSFTSTGADHARALPQVGNVDGD